MIILSLLSWSIFGIFVGILAKLFMPGKDSYGWIQTMGIGIAGSYFGGFIKSLIFGMEDFSPSGLIFSVLGGVLFLFIWRIIERYKILF